MTQLSKGNNFRLKVVAAREKIRALKPKFKITGKRLINPMEILTKVSFKR